MSGKGKSAASSSSQQNSNSSNNGEEAMENRGHSVVIAREAVQVTKLNRKTVLGWQTYTVGSNLTQGQRNDCVPPAQQANMPRWLMQIFPAGEAEQWATWDNTTLFNALLRVVPSEEGGTELSGLNACDEYIKLKTQFNKLQLSNTALMADTMALTLAVEIINENFKHDLTGEEVTDAVEQANRIRILNNAIHTEGDETNALRKRLKFHMINTGNKPKTVKEWLDKLVLRVKSVVETKQEYALLVGREATASGGTHQAASPMEKKRKQESTSSNDNSNTTHTNPGVRRKCMSCGLTNHTRDQCKFRAHPEANSTESEWDDSTMGRAWAEKGHTKLLAHMLLNGDRCTMHFPDR